MVRVSEIFEEKTNRKNSPFFLSGLIFIFCSIFFIFLSVFLTGSSFAQTTGSVGPSSAVGSAAIFYRNLSLGVSGQDVLALQKFLNQDPATQILSDGSTPLGAPGSSGHETTYFGIKTQQAVIKFQEKYAQEILTPNNLVQGNGFVGPATRQKIISLISGKINAVVADTAPTVTSISPDSAKNGTAITITGQNFDLADNTVLVSWDATSTYTHIPSKDSKTISFVMNSTISNQIQDQTKGFSQQVLDKVMKNFPQSLKLFVAVENKNGRSNMTNFNLILK
ncbi:MAG: IPT/TIG domain-containing protein [Candidatus Pacebacteria bacterium]|nr:IPT/TIG domain-containing protein [Candidatus Paceibacterota bacterium]